MKILFGFLLGIGFIMLMGKFGGFESLYSSNYLTDVQWLPTYDIRYSHPYADILCLPSQKMDIETIYTDNKETDEYYWWSKIRAFDPKEKWGGVYIIKLLKEKPTEEAK